MLDRARRLSWILLDRLIARPLERLARRLK
jgi:hypothetical protein